MNREQLIAWVEASEVLGDFAPWTPPPPQFLFFWGHQGRPGAEVGKECLSQWYPAPFTVDGVRYPTAEHWMMAAKARWSGDNATLAKILETTSPARAKELGRQVRGFDPVVWDDQKYRIVVEGSTHKFSQNVALSSYLRTTGDKVLVEASPYDTVWGIKRLAHEAEALDPRKWQGENLLGFALMDARYNLDFVAR